MWTWIKKWILDDDYYEDYGSINTKRRVHVALPDSLSKTNYDLTEWEKNNCISKMKEANCDSEEEAASRCYIYARKYPRVMLAAIADVMESENEI